MIPKECKRLAEVDFPIAVVSKHAAREKSIRHGHPSTLHLWWARRPLAACRSMLLALLLPDPCDPACPDDFKQAARETLQAILGIREGDEGLRKALLTFIGDVANWDVANHSRWIGVARELVKAAHGDEVPLVVDPFAGGGSIPLEALRLGCEAFASDLNPVACLILKTMLEDIPRHGPKLAEELRRVGAEVKQAAEKELAEFYPTDPDGAKPIAYLWARTVRCEAPNCGAEIPLIRSFWLCKKANRRRALRYKVNRPVGAQQAAPVVEFEIFEPKTESEVTSGTVTRAKATCLYCGTVLAPDRVRAQLRVQRGGADVVFDEKGNRVGGARVLAVVTLKLGEQGRQYQLPTQRDYEAVCSASLRLAKLLEESCRDGSATISPVPDEPLPPQGTLGFRVQLYGMTQWCDLFTARQKLALVTLGKAVIEARADFDQQQDDRSAIQALLAMTVNKQADYLSSLCTWHYHNREKVNHTFARQALPFVSDFVETVFFGSGSGNWDGLLNWTLMTLETASSSIAKGSAEQADACNSPLPHASCDIWFTDPPYYDAIPYSDLSDFFFVWLKRALPGHPLLRDPFDPKNPLTPKTLEVVQDETKQVDGSPKGRAFFEETMARAFTEGRRVLKDDGIGCVVFAHKTT